MSNKISLSAYSDCGASLCVSGRKWGRVAREMHVVAILTDIACDIYLLNALAPESGVFSRAGNIRTNEMFAIYISGINSRLTWRIIRSLKLMCRHVYSSSVFHQFHSPEYVAIILTKEYFSARAYQLHSLCGKCS